MANRFARLAGESTQRRTEAGLGDPVASLAGVSTAFAATVGKALNLYTVGDLLAHYPLRYEDRTHLRTIAELRHGETASIQGKVVDCENVPTRSRITLTKVTVNDRTGRAQLVFFNQWYVKKAFEKLKGTHIVAYGRVSRASRSIELTDVEWETFNPDRDSLSAERIVPIYPLAEGVVQDKLRKAAHTAVSKYAHLVPDRLPALLRDRQSLPSMDAAVRDIHFPVNEPALANARRRLIFDEFLELQLILGLRRRRAMRLHGNSFADTQSPINELTAALPFSLTGAQQRAITEIAADMRTSRPMNRLVQGDVGSGKTVVAMAALLIAVRNGHQAALMAPTEILAEQHYLGIKSVMEALRVQTILLTGSLTASQKQSALDAIAMGLYEVVVGTHALIQEVVRFQSLGLAVVDEQHRFGVLQRAALKQKGTSTPELLVMTATPIPRTLTLTVYGDLDVTVIDELPPGRKPVKTHWKRSEERFSVYQSLAPLLREGRQAYVICSLIEENEKLQARAATDLAAELQSVVFPEFHVGLLHGQMRPSEKEDVMLRFRDRRLDVLVATTVIEVGVDVPNASVIIIEDADRFGLAQLHQLRGRVGRGTTQSYCLLIGDPKTAVGEARLEVMTRTTDGFEIAEEDLKLRGPGDFYGTRQSGMQSLPFLDVDRDVPVLHEARREALALLAEDPQMNRAEHHALKTRVRDRYHELAGAMDS
ncbi:MAG: ATP-dependent DNA helicase RecG [Capsulimonadaceae bacterium]